MAAIWPTGALQRIRRLRRSGFFPLRETRSPSFLSNPNLLIGSRDSPLTASGSPTRRTPRDKTRLPHSFPRRHTDLPGIRARRRRAALARGRQGTVLSFSCVSEQHNGSERRRKRRRNLARESTNSLSCREHRGDFPAL